MHPLAPVDCVLHPGLALGQQERPPKLHVALDSVCKLLGRAVELSEDRMLQGCLPGMSAKERKILPGQNDEGTTAPQAVASPNRAIVAVALAHCLIVAHSFLVARLIEVRLGDEDE